MTAKTHPGQQQRHCCVHLMSEVAAGAAVWVSYGSDDHLTHGRRCLRWAQLHVVLLHWDSVKKGLVQQHQKALEWLQA